MADEELKDAIEEVHALTEDPKEVMERTEEIHPLEEGGVRFNEIYARMKAAEDRERAKDERLARLEGQAQALRQPPLQQPTVYTPQQLQQAVDQGLVTPMVAADILARQNAETAAIRTVAQAEQLRQANDRLKSAGTEVNQYMDRIPSLRDTNSPEFRRVADAAYRISDDMGLPVTDLRVQRVALREVYGSLDRMANTSQEREASRRASLPHVETSLGGTRPMGAPQSADAWKKDIPQVHLDHWKRRGYTDDQMKEEAKYIRK